MPVLLTSPGNIPSSQRYDEWCNIGCLPPKNIAHNKVPMLAEKLENAFDAIGDEWFKLSRQLNSKEVSSQLCHTTSCNTNVSDFGVMLAWSRLYSQWENDSTVVLVICEDPWLFRHFVSLGGEVLTSEPNKLWREVVLFTRGLMARTFYMLNVMGSYLTLKGDHYEFPKKSLYIISYGHPDSSSNGKDAYFGELMKWEPDIVRLLHTDCGIRKVLGIKSKQRSFSLHTWGSLWFAFTLPFQTWRVSKDSIKTSMEWLIRRAIVLEASKGQPAAIAWQIHCQSRWIRACKPKTIMWPWENHSWEQALVREANLEGVTSLGYQHSVVGRRHWVHSVKSNRDGIDRLPSRIICSGEIWLEALLQYGIPQDRMDVGGSLRYPLIQKLSRSTLGPVFVALPYSHLIADQIILAIKKLALAERFSFLIRGHPMNPYFFEIIPGVSQVKKPLTEMSGIGAVLYSATTVGLEALVGGLPVVRFIPEQSASVDVIPEFLDVLTATEENLGEQLDRAITSDVKTLVSEDFFCPPDQSFWKSLAS